MEEEESSGSVNNCLEDSFDLDIISEVLGPNMTKSDRENDSYSNTDWVERKAASRIDEFSDLNQGEKYFFKLWNRHVRSLQGVGVTHMSAVVLRSAHLHLI